MRRQYWEQYLLFAILLIVDAILFIPRLLLSPIYAVLKAVPYFLLITDFPLTVLQLFSLIAIYIFAPIARSIRIISPVVLLFALPFLIVGEIATFLGARDERFMGMSLGEKQQLFEMFRSYPRKEKF